MTENQLLEEKISADQFRIRLLEDYKVCAISREASLLARKEVLTGKAKFGIIGDGKEVPQILMSKYFRNGDFRSGYYRDQTFMFASGLSSVKEFFAQLYADAINDPFSGGRQMNSHYATQLIDKNTGKWERHIDLKNVSSDVSCTGGQMARAVGLALASKKYRENPSINEGDGFSHKGDEIVFVTIGDASTSEGVFWESVNAAAVQQIPMLINVWDDGYGISVPKKYQTTKESISEALAGFQSDEDGEGIDIYVVKGWDYVALNKTYEIATEKIRRTHKPALIHVTELTQPQGHSTSGSHERYKDKDRLKWEKEHDCLKKMGEWMVSIGMASQEELDNIQKEAKKEVKADRDAAWREYHEPLQGRKERLLGFCQEIRKIATANHPELDAAINALKRNNSPILHELVSAVRRVISLSAGLDSPALDELKEWNRAAKKEALVRYKRHLYSETPNSALRVDPVAPVYTEDSKRKNGYEILNAFFDAKLKEMPELFAFGEDVGHIGDVNQGFAGLQEKYGIERVFDTGIREWTIMGQAIGMAMRGLRPIAEIQYLDYLIYGLQPLSDDLATLRWRSDGIQAAPAIIRTRGHRLEGIWHAGSPMGMILHSLRGMYVCVPRNMTQAAGMYNTLLSSDDPALVVECLNGYRLKETQPENISEFKVSLGVPEVISEGTDITLVTYGSTLRVAEEAIRRAALAGISVELVDVQTLLPFDLESRISVSLAKTNRLLIVDEDVPGGASAFILREIMEKQNGFRLLDSQPVTLTAAAHRPAYGSDGDYYSKPNPEDIFEAIYKIMNEVDPARFPDMGLPL